MAEAKLCRKYDDDIGQVLNFQAIPMLPEVLTGNWCYRYVWAAQPIRVVFGYLLQLQFQGQGPFLCFLKTPQFVPGMLKDQQTADHKSS